VGGGGFPPKARLWGGGGGGGGGGGKIYIAYTLSGTCVHRYRDGSDVRLGEVEER